MKNYIYLVLSACAIGISTLTSHAFADVPVSAANAPIYAQVSSLENQFPKGAQLITLEKIDKLVGIEHQEARLIIQEPGVYFIMAAGQAGVDSKQTTAEGFVDLWLIINGQDVPNSGVRQFLATPEATSVIVSQNILVLKKGDALTFGYSSSKPSVGFVSTGSNHTQPAIPSMIVSLYKI